jgi:hypothetical protein
MTFEIETQLQDQWCWAAVSASIEKYYAGPNNWTQCSIASYVLGSNCCGDPGPCNTAAYLQNALQLIQRLRGIRLRSLTFDEIRAELSAGNPVGVRIAWQGGGAHFVVIRGFRNPAGFQLLNVADPWYEDSIQDFDDFTFTYLGQGLWTDSFLVGS